MNTAWRAHCFCGLGLRRAHRCPGFSGDGKRQLRPCCAVANQKRLSSQFRKQRQHTPGSKQLSKPSIRWEIVTVPSPRWRSVRTASRGSSAQPILCLPAQFRAQATAPPSPSPSRAQPLPRASSAATRLCPWPPAPTWRSRRLQRPPRSCSSRRLDPGRDDHSAAYRYAHRQGGLPGRGNPWRHRHPRQRQRELHHGCLSRRGCDCDGGVLFRPGGAGCGPSLRREP